MSWLVILPVLLPLAAAGLAVALIRRPRALRLVGIGGPLAQAATAGLLLARVAENGPLAMQMGNWPAPFGITFAADLLSAGMAAVTGIVGLAVAIYAEGERGDQPAGAQPALLLVLLAGVAGGFLTGDVFNLYVWFEVMLIATFGLLALGGNPRQLDSTVKYAAINLVATALFLIATGLLYGITGTLNMADLGTRAATYDGRLLLAVVAMLYALSLGIKAAVFPLFFWLPASYHTPAASVAAVFAALMTKIAIYVLIRLFTLVFPAEAAALSPLLLAVAAATMVIGAVGAVAEREFRRVIAFNLISGIGFILLGLALGSEAALLGAVFYTVHHILAMCALFLAGGLAERHGGSGEIARLGGLYEAQPLLATLFLIAGLSLAGVPPLSGFWAKLFLVQASLASGQPLLAATALLAGFLTLISIGRLWSLAFWRPAPAAAKPIAADLRPRHHRLMLAPLGVLVLLGAAIGLWVAPLAELSGRAAQELLVPSAYLQAVQEALP